MKTRNRPIVSIEPAPMPDDFINQHMNPLVRLYALQVLNRFPGRTSELQLLSDALFYLGMRTSTDALRQQLRWLATADLVDLQEIDSWWVVTLTPKGEDVATSRMRKEGVSYLPGLMGHGV